MEQRTILAAVSVGYAFVTIANRDEASMILVFLANQAHVTLTLTLALQFFHREF